MASVTVQLSAEAEQQLRQRASQRGETLEVYLGRLAEREARGDGEVSDMLARGLDWLTKRKDEDVRAARERILVESPPPRAAPAGKSFLDAIEGKWPGTETDAEIRDALDRMS